MHPVHGLVLHQLCFKNGRRYRGESSAIGNDRSLWGQRQHAPSWKHVLDASEYNMGMVNSLKLGCDCLGEIFYFDVHQVTSLEGKVKSVENAICMHEEDYGIP